MPKVDKKLQEMYISKGYRIFETNKSTLKNIDKKIIDVMAGIYFSQHNLLSDFSNLKFIQLSTAGYNKVPIEEIISRGIRIANASGVTSIPIAEWTIARILDLYKFTNYYFDNQNKKIWERGRTAKELNNSKVCIFGTGNIGGEIAIRLKAFNCFVDGVNSTGREVSGFNKCYDFDTVMNVLDYYDICVFALPSNLQTRGKLNASFFEKMKDQSVIINVGRGDLINEEDLKIYIERNKFFGIALDVTEVEPLPQNSSLWLYENVIISPHASFMSQNNDERLFSLVWENLERFELSQNLINEIVR